MNLFDLTLRFNGFPIREARKELNKLYSLNDTALQQQIEHKKSEILNFHLTHNSFYKSFTKCVKINNWNDVPVISKYDLQLPLKKRLTKGFTKNNCYVNKTSGSSGNPLIFAKSRFAHAMTWSVFYKWYNWYGVHNKKQARFYGIPKSGLLRLKERLKDLLSNRYRFDVFDLSESALDSWIDVFSKNKFVYITGYTTVITAFARHLISKNIVLSNICPTLKVCFPTSEMCSDDDKALISKAFNIPVAKEYGAAEFGLIALEKDTKWVLNNLNLYVEILDEHNNVLPYGEEGRIVITDLYNKAHPFIRYDIGDIGKIAIDNNSLVLESIIGRKEDYIKLPSGKTVPGLAFYYVTKAIMQDDGNVTEIKVTQTTINCFEIQYVSHQQLTGGQEQQIKKALDKYLEPSIELSFVKQDTLRRTKRGKLKQFTSLLKQ